MEPSSPRPARSGMGGRRTRSVENTETSCDQEHHSDASAQACENARARHGTKQEHRVHTAPLSPL
eukprot:3472092-Pyramimonas_sp.AAC.1